MYRNQDVFIGTPTHICKRYCAHEFTQGLLTAPPETGKYIVCNSTADASDYYFKYPGHNIYFRQLSLSNEFFGQRDSIHRRLVFTMNFLRDLFLDTTAMLYLSLEADVILSRVAFDEILYTLAHNKDIDILHTNCYKGFNTVNKLSPTDRITLGCTAIKRQVLEKVKFRYDENVLAAFHDAFFGSDALQAGFKMYYHPFIKLDHLRNNNNSRGWDELLREELR